MNKIINFTRKMSLFAKKMELASRRMVKQTEKQLLETQKEFLNDIGITTDNVTELEIREKAEEILKDF